MKITLFVIGKTDEKYLREGIEKYLKRLAHYSAFEMIEYNIARKWQSLPPAQIMQKEAEAILQQMEKPIIACCSMKRENHSPLWNLLPLFSKGLITQLKTSFFWWVAPGASMRQ
jgi:23S rRNA pseudoU1915 N3-methylase RlmH